jgi:Kef-type K+ transport system membrane component KefB
MDTFEVSLAAAESSELAPLDEHEVLVFLVQLILLIGVARTLGGVLKRLGQPPVVGELLAGIVLGPSVFQRVWPSGYDWVFTSEPVVNSAVFAIAWLGVIMLLVAIGFETDLAVIRQFRRAALWVSGGSLLVPLVLFGALAFAVPDSFIGANGTRAVFAPFFALALSVSALPVVAKILQDLGFLRRNFGQITLAAGMTMDSIGWLILAALSGVALQGNLNLGSLLVSLGGLLVFLVVAATAGRWLIDQMFRRSLRGGSSVTAALSTTVVAALIGGAITQALNLEAILGAFIMGILLGVTRHQLPRVQEILETITASFFAPVFFAYTGLRVDFGALESGSAVVWTVVVVVLAVVAKVVGTWLGAWRGGLEPREGLALGAGLSALGAMGIVVAIIAFNLAVVSESGFTVLVLAAIVTSLVAPALLRLVVRDWEIPVSERRRLDEESLRDASVILRTRRVLLPTRGGANSAYAAKLLAGMFTQLDVTVMSVDVVERGLIDRLRHRGDTSSDPTDVLSVLAGLDHVTTRSLRRSARSVEDAIVDEARLGYDLVVLGASEEESEGTRLFSTLVDRTLSTVQIPSLVVRFPSSMRVTDALPSHVLVPVTRTISARAAEEIAYSIVKASGGSVVAMHVINRPEGHGMMLAQVQADAAREAAADMLAQAVELGDRLGIGVTTTIRVAPNAEEELVAAANGGDFDLLVLGTATRPLSDRAFLGHRSSYIIENAAIPVVIVSLPERTR